MAVLKLESPFLNIHALKEAIASSTTIGQVLKKLGLSSSPGHYRHFHHVVQKEGIEILHFLGKSHLRGTSHQIPSAIPLADVLVENSSYGSSHLRRRLIRTKVLEDACSVCGQGPEWNGKPLTLELDHINGDHTDNRLPNLRIICPHCHSQTPSFRGKKQGRYSKHLGREGRPCATCGKSLPFASKHASQCAPCYQATRETKIVWPEPEVVLSMVKESSYIAAGLALGVTDNTIRRFLRKHYGSIPRKNK